MNPQDIINQNIRMLIGDLQVSLMIANARVQELETEVSRWRDTAVQAEEPSEVSWPNGKHVGAPHAT